MPLKYLPNFVPNTFIIIGCGGTGSRLVPLVAQFIKTCKWIIDPEIVLVDFDTVEEKNLSRQNFIHQDVGKNKAEVLAGRYMKAFGVPISAFNTQLTLQNLTDAGSPLIKWLWNRKTDGIFRNSGVFNNSIIFMCVDSVAARKEIITGIGNKIISGYDKLLIIDSGNENNFGQVTLHGTEIPYPQDGLHILLKAAVGKAFPLDVTINNLPLDLEYFINMKETAAPSCAELDQTMAINSMMANVMFTILQNLLYANPIIYNRINVSLFDGVIPQIMNAAYMQREFLKGQNLFEICRKPVRTDPNYPFITRVSHLITDGGTLGKACMEMDTQRVNHEHLIEKARLEDAAKNEKSAQNREETDPTGQNIGKTMGPVKKPNNRVTKEATIGTKGTEEHVVVVPVLRLDGIIA